MEKKSSKKTSSATSTGSSSSSIAELFGPKDSSSYSKSSSSSSPSGSSSSIFGSVFGPTSMGRGRDSTGQARYAKHGAPDNMAQNSKGENSKGSYYQQDTTDQPCYFSSSIYYGGQEVYSPTTQSTESQLPFKKDQPDDDPNSASRGNWWQGSLYY